MIDSEEKYSLLKSEQDGDIIILLYNLNVYILCDFYNLLLKISDIFFSNKGYIQSSFGSFIFNYDVISIQIVKIHLKTINSGDISPHLT